MRAAAGCIPSSSPLTVHKRFNQSITIREKSICFYSIIASRKLKREAS